VSFLVNLAWEQNVGPKDLEVKRIMKEMSKEERKVVHFCKYNAQAQKYYKMFESSSLHRHD